MYGKAEYQEINQLFNDRLTQVPFLIACHRGFAHADLIENTVDAMRMARLLGADIMETDTTPTADERLVMMHPHRERQLFDQDVSVSEMALTQLRTLRLHNNIGAPTNQHVNTLAEFLTNVPQGMLVHLDRNETHLALLLGELDRYPQLLPQLMIKVAPTPENYRLLAAHPVKYMVIPVINDAEELALTFQQRAAAINLVGLETIITKQHAGIITPTLFKRIRTERLAPLANALDLGSNAAGRPVELFGSYDDHQSLFGDPLTSGWYRMAKLGVKMINTDWPRELNALRKTLR